jgi:hypothetical protein
VVIRRLWLDLETADYAREALNYPELRILARVDCEQRRGGVVESLETRYFACSMDPAGLTPAGLLGLIRGHWQVENSLHYIKDRWWDEDRHYTVGAAKGLALATLRNGALSILRVAPGFAADEPIRARADELNWDVDRAIDLLTKSVT